MSEKIILKFENNDFPRIDKYLSHISHEELYSRSFIEKLLKNGHIFVNKQQVKKNYLLKKDDLIEIEITRLNEPTCKPQNIPLNIVFEDEHFLIINKPAGITVHPAPGNPDSTIVNALTYHFGENLSSGTDPLRPGIVHRLDKNTSGLMIIAKNDKIHSLLSSMFQNRMVEKYYKAILVGTPKERSGTIETFIDRSKNDRKKMTVTSKGKLAITHYEILKDYDFFSTAIIKLETGRTHQIRVHFSYLNCPILGDTTYSNLKRNLNIIPSQFHKRYKNLLEKHLTRQALHSYKLKFIHPITEENMEVESDLPEDIVYTLNWLEKNFG